MAVTEMSLVILASVAILASAGMLRQLGDRMTNLVIALAAAFSWAALSFSATDVIVRDTYAATASDPIWPLVYAGAAFALISFVVTIDRFMTVVSGSASASETGGIASERR